MWFIDHRLVYDLIRMKQNRTETKLYTIDLLTKLEDNDLFDFICL